MAVAIPVALSTLGTLITNLNNPEHYAQMMKALNQPSLLLGVMGPMFGVKNEYSQVEVEYTINGLEYADTWLFYIGGYFAALYGFLLSLMGYNLIKMFGIDDNINTISKDIIEWFTTPGRLDGSQPEQ